MQFPSTGRLWPKTTAAVLASVLCVAFGAFGAPAIAAPGSGGGQAAGAQTYAHDYPGAPKDTKRCRRLLRKIDRADRKGNHRRVRKLSRRYNEKCRTR